MRKKIFAAVVFFIYLTTVFSSEQINNAINVFANITGKIVTGFSNISDSVDTFIKKVEENQQKKLNENVSDTEYGKMQVHYIDVGQGDATLIISDEQAILIDAGDNSKGTAIQSYLKKQGIGKDVNLKYVIGTHADADHVGGLDVVITKFDCEQILLPNTDKDTKTYQDVLNAVDYKGYKIHSPTAGESFGLNKNVSFTIVAPNAIHDEENDKSIGLVLQHGQNRFLFMGDAEEESEITTLNVGWDVSADVYKVSHHGSRSSTSDAFLQKVNPSYAVISCGENNDYGHPHAETLNTLRSNNIEVFRTDEQGSIICYSNGTDIKWNTMSSTTWVSGNK